MVGNQLLLFFFSHFGEGVVLALELAFKSVESSDDLLLDGKALLAVDGGAEWEFCEVTSDTDAGRVNHFVFIWREVWAVELRVIHGADMLIVGAMTMVGLDDSVHEWSEVIVTLMGASVDADSGVGPLTAGEDGLAEGEAVLVLAIFALLPNLTS